MADVPIESDRNSSLNKTMVISKKTPRPGLPNITSDSSTNEPVHERDDQTTLKSTQPKRQRTSTVTLHSDKAEDEEADKARMEEIKQEIRNSMEQKENFLNSEGEDRIDKMASLMFRCEVATQAARYADQFFCICERNGIDIKKVLASDPDTLYSMKLQSNALTPTTADETIKELKAMKSEREHFAEEAKSLKSSYSNLFKLYEKLRTNYDLMGEARKTLSEKVEQQQQAMNDMYKTAVDLKDVMLEEAARADQTIAETKGKYDSDTVTIRMNLIRLENENNSLRSEITGKNNEISELRRIIQEIVKQVNVEVIN